MDEDKNLKDNITSRRLDFEEKNNIRNDLHQTDIDGNNHIEVCEKLNSNCHSNISHVKIPQVGMEFDDEEAAYNFYNNYVKMVGFSVRIHACHKDSNEIILDRMFCCSSQGQRRKDKRDVSIKSHRPETRTGCCVEMKVNTRETGKFKIVSFVASHSGHNLVSSNKSHILRSQRSITIGQATQISNLDRSGIRPKAGLNYIVSQVGGRENVGFIIEDYRNYLRSRRTMDNKIGDTGGVLEYLQQMQSDDPNFFYAIQVDSDDLITNIFWADGQMVADFTYFGDVVSFDTTYRKNKEGRPFALFVGVNHHKQTIIFGTALLYDETAQTFMWLFDMFAKTMQGKKHVTILTDQDAAMAKALPENWPETYHRLCIWHIYQNTATHLSSVFSSFKDFSKDFSSCIYDYEEEDFLEVWQEMLDKYGLHNNQWLERMLKIKEKWSLVYGRQVCCADITTTQRSESMNSVLKKYVNYKHDLLQFFQYFRRLIDDRRHEELKADFRTNHSTPVLSFRVEILKHAVSVYTHETFQLFQDELSKAHDSRLEIIAESETTSQYKIAPFKKQYQHTIIYDSSNDKVSCSCKKFDFAGILCSHALKVLSHKNIVRIPDFYIKKRWTKKTRKWTVEVSSRPSNRKIGTLDHTEEEGENIKIGIRYKELCHLLNQLVTHAALTEETFELTRGVILKLIEEVDTSLENRGISKQALYPKINMEKQKLENDCDEIIARWLKVKQTRVKSGKDQRVL